MRLSVRLAHGSPAYETHDAQTTAVSLRLAPDQPSVRADPVLATERDPEGPMDLYQKASAKGLKLFVDASPFRRLPASPTAPMRSFLP